MQMCAYRKDCHRLSLMQNPKTRKHAHAWMIPCGRLESLPAACFTEVSEECGMMSRERDVKILPGDFYQHVRNVCGSLQSPWIITYNSPLGNGAMWRKNQCVVAASLSLSADWATRGISNAKSKVSSWAIPDAERQTEGERDRLPNKVTSDLSLSSSSCSLTRSAPDVCRPVWVCPGRWVCSHKLSLWMHSCNVCSVCATFVLAVFVRKLP